LIRKEMEMSERIPEDQRQAGEFTEEESRIHRAGFKIILEGLQKGLGFDEACTGLEVVEPEIRRIIIDDYLKVTIAERHFQGREELEDVAGSLKIPLERVAATREKMLKEVREAAREVYRKQAGDAGFTMDSVPSEDEGNKGS
jgi:hypothetical protein